MILVPRTQISRKRLVLAALYAGVMIVLNTWPVQVFEGETGHPYCCQEVYISHFRGWPVPFVQRKEIWSYPHSFAEALPPDRAPTVPSPSRDKERRKERQDFGAAWDARVDAAKDEPIPYAYIPFCILVLDQLPQALALILGALLDALVLFGGAALILYIGRRGPNPGVERPSDD